MPNLIYEIETLSNPDTRSNEVPIKLLIRNETTERVKLLTIVPNIPDNVELEEKQDVFQEESKKQFQELCEELTLITDSVLINTNAPFKEKYIKTYTDVYKEIFNNMPSIYKWMLIDRTMLKSRIRYFNKQSEKLQYKISNFKDADWALLNIIENDGKDFPEKVLYQGKYQQLKGLSGNLENLSENYIAYIEPKSFYSRTYVLKFTRDMLSIKLYNISFDSKYSDDNSTTEYRANTSTTIQISPNPISLTLFTCVCCILGVALKFSIKPDNSNNYIEFFNKLGNIIITSQGVTAIIVGLLFFNIFEFTDLGKNLKSEVNWRTALLIGILSGMFSDRLIEAVKVFAGL